MKKSQLHSCSTRIGAVLLTASMIISLTACGFSSETRKNAASIKAENAPSSSISESSASSSYVSSASSLSTSAYPLQISTYGSDGQPLTTTYTKAPEKVLAIYQGSIETMLTLGLSDHLIATAGLDNSIPDNLKADFSKVKYLDEFTPSLETVTMLQPDMILSWGSLFQEKTLGNSGDWIKRGVNIYINSNTRPATGDTKHPRTLDNEYTDILNLGKIFQVQPKAESIVNDMKNTIISVTAQTSDIKSRPSVLILESTDQSFTNYGADTLGGDMVTALGGKLLNSDSAELGKEDVVAANPDVIFVVYMPYSGDDAEKVKQEKLDVILKDKAYASINAVKNNRIVPIKLSEMYASATRTKDGIVTFAKGLYPDIRLDEK